MNTISLTKEEILKRIARLEAELERTMGPTQEVIKKQIKHWKEVLDRFYANEAFRNPGNEYSDDDLQFIKEQEGWTSYKEGQIAGVYNR